jgi:hypothetical protein
MITMETPALPGQVSYLTEVCSSLESIMPYKYKLTIWNLRFCSTWRVLRLVYQYNENNVMHFSFSLLRIKGLSMPRALLAHPQEALNKRHLVYCMRIMSVGCATNAVSARMQIHTLDRTKRKNWLFLHRSVAHPTRIGWWGFFTAVFQESSCVLPLSWLPYILVEDGVCIIKPLGKKFENSTVNCTYIRLGLLSDTTGVWR